MKPFHAVMSTVFAAVVIAFIHAFSTASIAQNTAAAPEPPGGFVIRTQAQDLTDFQKATARSNIGAAGITSTAAAGSLVVSSTTLKVYTSATSGIILSGSAFTD